MQKALNERFFNCAFPLISQRAFQPLPTQLFRVSNQRAINLYAVAIMDFVMQLDRTAVDADFIFRQIDIFAQRQNTAGDNRLLDRCPSLQLHALQVLFFRQRIGDFNHNISRHDTPLWRAW